MLIITPKTIMIILLIFLIVFLANYPMFLIFGMIYYTFISPNNFIVLLITIFSLVFLIYLETMGEKWWRGPCAMIIFFSLTMLVLRIFFNIDPYKWYGPLLSEAFFQLKETVFIFIAYITALFEAFFQVGFSIDMIIKVILPVYILYNICMALFRYSAIFSDRTASFLSFVMAIVGAKGGVLNKILSYFISLIFKAFTDPLTLSFAIIIAALILITIDGIIDILWYVMSVTPEERQNFWSQALGGEGIANTFTKIARRFRNNPSLLKFAKLRTLDPTRIADVHFQTLKFSNVRASAPTDIHRITGFMNRGAFSASPVYSAPAMKIFNWLSGSR